MVMGGCLGGSIKLQYGKISISRFNLGDLGGLKVFVRVEMGFEMF